MVTKGYGITVHDIDWSCPADLEPYSKAYEMQTREKDYMNWLSNQYTLSAVYVAIEHCFSSKAKSQYTKHPILRELHEKEEISEEKRIEMENYKLAMSLRIMQANFEINNGRKD